MGRRGKEREGTEKGQRREGFWCVGEKGMDNNAFFFFFFFFLRPLNPALVEGIKKRKAILSLIRCGEAQRAIEVSSLLFSSLLVAETNNKQNNRKPKKNFQELLTKTTKFLLC